MEKNKEKNFLDPEIEFKIKDLKNKIGELYNKDKNFRDKRCEFAGELKTNHKDAEDYLLVIF